MDMRPLTPGNGADRTPRSGLPSGSETPLRGPRGGGKLRISDVRTSAANRCYGLPDVDTRTQRVEAIATYMATKPEEAEKLTGPTVEQLYKKYGIEVSGRQARRDIEDARRIAADRLRSPTLPHWSEDVTGAAIRATIETVLRSDRRPTIPQLRQAVTAAHGRAIGDGELRQIARRAYRRIYIDPAVAGAHNTLREQPGYSWAVHQARAGTDPPQLSEPVRSRSRRYPSPDVRMVPAVTRANHRPR